MRARSTVLIALLLGCATGEDAPSSGSCDDRSCLDPSLLGDARTLPDEPSAADETPFEDEPLAAFEDAAANQDRGAPPEDRDAASPDVPADADVAASVDAGVDRPAPMDVVVDLPARDAPVDRASPPDAAVPVDRAPPPDAAAPVCPGGCAAAQGCQQNPGTCASGGVCAYAPLPAGTACRPAACVGDLAETCTGASASCPAPCGCAGEPCCAGSRCGGGLSCSGGTCRACAAASPSVSGRAERDCAGGCVPIEEIRGEGGYLEVRSGSRRDRISFLAGVTATGRVRTGASIRSVRAAGNQILFDGAALTLSGATASGSVDFAGSELAAIEGVGATIRVTDARGVGGVITLTTTATCP